MELYRINLLIKEKVEKEGKWKRIGGVKKR